MTKTVYCPKCKKTDFDLPPVSAQRFTITTGPMDHAFNTLICNNCKLFFAVTRYGSDFFNSSESPRVILNKTGDDAYDSIDPTK